MAMMLASVQLNAQLYYFDDFEDQSLAGYTLVNLDGLTPDDPDLATMADSAWTIRNITAQGWEYGYSAFSVSWYEGDAGPSDDWLITPAIEIGEDATLSWSAMAITSSGDYRDQYQVFVANEGTIDDFALVAPLYDTGSQGEIDEPQDRFIDLAAGGFENETIYVAFRNWTQPYDPDEPTGPGNGGNELCIDNIRVEGPATGIAENHDNFGAISIFPNPATRGVVTLQFSLNTPDRLQMTVFDQTGRSVRTLDFGKLPEGDHLFPLETDDLSPGSYTFNIRGNHSNTQKVLIVK